MYEVLLFVHRCSNKQTSLSEVYDFASEVADQMIVEKHEVTNILGSHILFVVLKISWNNVDRL